jgi:hypothetical protein
LHNLGSLIEEQQPPEHNPLFTLGSFDWQHTDGIHSLPSLIRVSLSCLHIYYAVFWRFISLPHTLDYCSYFITPFINILTTVMPIFIYSHDVCFISIWALMTLHTHNFIRILRAPWRWRSCSAETCRSKTDILNIWFTLKTHFVGLSFIIKDTYAVFDSTGFLIVQMLTTVAFPWLQCTLFIGDCYIFSNNKNNYRFHGKIAYANVTRCIPARLLCSSFVLKVYAIE